LAVESGSASPNADGLEERPEQNGKHERGAEHGGREKRSVA
jgi:hypothetical protein